MLVAIFVCLSIVEVFVFRNSHVLQFKLLFDWVVYKWNENEMLKARLQEREEECQRPSDEMKTQLQEREKECQRPSDEMKARLQEREGECQRLSYEMQELEEEYNSLSYVAIERKEVCQYLSNQVNDLRWKVEQLRILCDKGNSTPDESTLRPVAFDHEDDGVDANQQDQTQT
jgi:chromosome segregation ATPase